MGPRMHKDIFLVAIRGVDKISFEVFIPAIRFYCILLFEDEKAICITLIDLKK